MLFTCPKTKRRWECLCERTPDGLRLWCFGCQVEWNCRKLEGQQGAWQALPLPQIQRKVS